MKHTIELSEDQCDLIAVKCLMEAYRYNCKPNKIDCSDDEIPVDQKFLDAIDLVLGYFCNADGLDQWNIEKRKWVK